MCIKCLDRLCEDFGMRAINFSLQHWLLRTLSLILICFLSMQSRAAIVKGNTCDAIQKTINKLPTIGGEVFIPAGIYTCSTPVSYTHLRAHET